MEKKDYPFGELARVEDIVGKTLERAFSDFFFPRRWKREQEEMVPACDLIDKGDHLFLRAEIPGLKKEDIDISIDETSVSLKGEIKREKEEKGETYYRSERYYGEFLRIIDLPAEVNPNAVDATLKDGILEVKLPKKKVWKGKKVEIKVK